MKEKAIGFKPLISIVMPAYNAEKYLSAAIESVAAQTEEDWELILIDDASVDASGTIADRWAARDGRISVVHLPENGGLSAARNAGMALAKGRYLMFIDADDWIEPQLMAALREAAAEGGSADITVWGVEEEYFDESGRLAERRVVSLPAQTAEGAEAVRKCALRLEEATLLGYAWNKLYDMELIRRAAASFESVPLIEDILFNLSLIGHADSLRVLDIAPYHYARRVQGSLTHAFLPRYWETHERRVREMLGLYAGWGMKDAAIGALAPVYARYALSALSRNCEREAGMTRGMRRRFALDMLRSGLYRELKPAFRRGKDVPSRVLNSGSASALLIAGRAAWAAKRWTKGLFARLSRRKRGNA